MSKMCLIRSNLKNPEENILNFHVAFGLVWRHLMEAAIFSSSRLLADSSTLFSLLASNFLFRALEDFSKLSSSAMSSSFLVLSCSCWSVRRFHSSMYELSSALRRISFANNTTGFSVLYCKNYYGKFKKKYILWRLQVF